MRVKLGATASAAARCRLCRIIGHMRTPEAARRAPTRDRKELFDAAGIRPSSRTP